MIAVICLAIAAALLFWPEPAVEVAEAAPSAPPSSTTSPKPKRRRKEAPKNVAKN